LVERIKNKWVALTKGNDISRIELGEKHVELRAKIKEEHVTNKKAANLLIRNFSSDLNRIVVIRSGDFEEICDQMIDHFESIYMQIGFLSRKIAFYLPGDLNEVHVACEPPLELVDDSSDTINILEKQLKIADKITFYISQRNIEEYKAKILGQIRSDNRFDGCDSKIAFVPIDRKLQKPCVVYFRKNGQDRYGFRAERQPAIVKKGGRYLYKEPYREKEFSYLTDGECSENLSELERRAI
jgi:hypothetical protein